MKAVILSTAVVAALMAGCVETKGGRTMQASEADIVAAQHAEPIVARTELAPALYELAYSPKQQALFVASAGGMDEKAPPSYIYRLNPDSLEIDAKIPLEYRGLGLRLDDQANRLYVGNAFDAAITIIDTTNNQVIDTIKLAKKVALKGFDGKPTERYPHHLRELLIEPTTERLFAPGIWIADSALYVIDLKRGVLEKVIDGFGFGAAGVTADPKQGKIYVSNLQGQLFVIDAQSLAIEKTFEIQADQLLNMVFDERTRRILAIDQGGDNVDEVREKLGKLEYQRRGEGNRVVVINPENGLIEKSIPTGTRPVNLVLDTERHRLIVTSRDAGTVSIYDRLSNDALVHTIELPTFPNTPALDPKSGDIFVTIKEDSQPAQIINESVAKISIN